MPSSDERIDKLATELDAAFRNRADLYRLLYDELCLVLRPEAAEAAMVRAIEKRGREVAAAAFSHFGPNDARAVGEAFLSASPDSGRLYPAEVQRAEDRISFRVRRCPLKDAWVDAAVDDEKLTVLCRVAGAFDRGLFEATGIRFQNKTWSPGHGSDCCHIWLADRDAAVGVDGAR